jgi:hypothetical protein
MMMNMIGLLSSIVHQEDLEDDDELGWLIIVFCGIYTK